MRTSRLESRFRTRSGTNKNEVNFLSFHNLMIKVIFLFFLMTYVRKNSVCKKFSLEIVKAVFQILFKPMSNLKFRSPFGSTKVQCASMYRRSCPKSHTVDLSYKLMGKVPFDFNQ
jgi:hypothetical protein